MALDRGLKTLVTDRVDRTRVGRPSAILRLRLVITVAFVALAAAWWAWAGGARPSGLYNPGHVTQAHAKFETDCQQCHDGNGRGGFSKAVSDGACVACHDGSIHHRNQLVAASAGDVSPIKTVLAVNDPHRPPGNTSRSAACVACHSEHKGQTALVSSDDAQCTQCHGALAKAATSQPAVSATIVAFDPNSHPAFGRTLVREDPQTGKPRLFDPTKLKFDHRKHAAQPELAGDNSCVLCHSTAVTPGPGPTPRTPPFVVAKLPSDERPFDSGKMMQPVRFDRHCIGCHQVTLPDTLAKLGVSDEDTDPAIKPQLSGIVLRHRSVAEMREQIATVVHDKLANAAAVVPPLDKVNKSELLPKAIADGPEDAQMEWIKAMSGLTPSQQWVRLNLVESAKDVNAYAEAKKLDIKASAMTLPDAPAAEALTEAKAVDYFTARMVFSSKGCVTCHDTQGDALAFAPPAPTDAAATAPAAVSLTTVPTGIPQTPRHWFAAGQFDHGKHGQMSCVACHSTFSGANYARIGAIADATAQAAAARAVSDTSFVNSPNQTWTQWTTAGGQPTAIDRSCVECHHPDRGAADRGNGSACVLCHQFHDRTKELPASTAMAK